MFWKVFFGVLAALIVFWLVIWLAFGVLLWGAGSAVEEASKQVSADYARQQQTQSLQREFDLYHAKMGRSVCRNGKAYVPRRSGSVTYYDPVVWHGTVVSCR